MKRRSKKLIIIAVLAAVVVAGSIVGVMVLADNNTSANVTANQPGAALTALWDKAAGILQNEGVNVTSDQLKGAFTQAQDEMRTEALQQRLQNMVAKGTITQEQADSYLNWQKAKPDMPAGSGFNGLGGFHGMRGFGGH